MRNDDTDPRLLSSRHLPRGRSLLAELESYWRDLRGARALPARTDVNPAAIDAILPHAFVAERVAPQVARLRVAGSRLNDLLGMEARGMPLCTFFGPEGRAALGPLLARLFDAPAIVEIAVDGSRGLLRGRVSGRLILLPLTDGHGHVSRAIGALLCDGATGRGPVRLGLAEGGAIRIEPVGLPVPLRALPPRLAAVGAGAAMHRGPDAARPALRLVVNNG